MKNIYTPFLLFALWLISSSLQAQTNVSGLINANTSWTLANSPYIVTGNVLVATGATLAIEAGVSVKVNSGLYIKIDGAIVAVGTNSSKITFESNTSNPAESDWGGIRIRPTGGSIIDGSQNYSSGSQFKYVKIKHATRGLYIYGTGLHISYSEFLTNNKAIEIRATENVVVDNCSFISNTFGIWSEYEDNTSGDGVNKIENTFIQNNIFSTNNTGVYLIMNQRDFVNLNINNNVIKDNTVGINFGGGGYGPKVHSVYIKNNIIYNNISNGVILNRVYGNGTGTVLDYPLEFAKNLVIDNGGSLAFELSESVKFYIHNNILKTINVNGIESIGNPSCSNHLFTKNTIISKSKSIFLGLNSFNYANSMNFTYNTFSGKSSSEVVDIRYGSGHVINFNNFFNPNSLYTVKNLTANAVNTENNFWGTTNEPEIQSLIYDFNDNFELGVVDYLPFLNSPNILAPISPPINVVKTLNGNNVILSWNSNLESDLMGYKLYYGSPTGYSYTNVSDLGNVTSYTIVNGNIDTEYAITAYDNIANTIDDQVDGNESWFSIANPLPELPTNIVVDSAPRKAKISWTLSTTSNVTGYKIFKGITPNPTTLLTTISNSTVSYIDTGLTNGTSYYYSIKAVDSNGLESVSSTDLIATPTNTWYVATSGTSTGFGSANSPMSSIQTAIDASVSGEIVQVSNGTYTENIIYTGKNITVTSLYSSTQNEADITNTIIDGGANGLPVVRLHNGETDNAKLIGFTIQNGATGTNEWGAGINIENSTAQLKNLKIKNNTCEQSWPKVGGIRLKYTNGVVLIENVEIFNNNGKGLYSWNNNSSGSFNLNNSKIYNNIGTAILIHVYQNPELPIKNTLIYNNTNPVVVQGSGLVFLNCTIVDNNGGGQSPILRFNDQCGVFNSIIGTNQIIENQGSLKISKSLIRDGQASILGAIGAVALTYGPNISSDPKFVDAAQSNYRLSNYSPAIGFGAVVNTISTVSYNAPTTDIEGALRPNPAGSNPDLGAYENSFATTQHNTTIYVATNGNNAGSVGLETAPFATIQAAINYSIDGDQILIKPGTYTEALSVNKAITIKSTNGYQQTTIKVSGVVGSIVTVLGQGNNLTPLNTTISGFKFISELNLNGVTAIRLENAAFANVEKCWFENLENSFSTYYGYYDVKNSIFKNNKYIGYHQSGYSNNDKLSRIINCNIINANTITWGLTQYFHKIYNTIITRENQSQEPYFSSGIFPLLDKVLIDANLNTQPGSVFTTIASVDDIYFNNVANNDYTLKNYSPAIGYGSALSNVIDDIDNNPRPTLSFPDIGAYENSLDTHSNAPPRINAVANVTINEDAAQQTINLSGIADGDLFATQTLTISHTNSNAALFSNFTINHSANAATGSLVFTPAPNAFGTADITITVQDNGGVANGGINSKTISFTITINPINDAPIAVDDSILVNEGATAVLLSDNATTLTNNDTDVDNVSLTATIVTQPTNGTLTLNSNGTFSYTHNGSETTSDSFTYKANDGELNSNIATVSITVTPVNDAPVGNNDTVSVNEGATVTVLSNSQTSVLQNDSDAENNTLTVSVVTAPTNGTLTLNNNGTFSYTHNNSETTTDSFTYKVNDGELDSNITTVNIIINPVNDNGPTDISVSNFSLNENNSSSTIGQFSVLDLDLPTDSHTYQLVSGLGDTNNSSFTINGTNLLNTVAFDYETQQTLSIRVKVTDANAVSYEKVFIINIENINDISITHSKTDSYCSGSAGNGTITINAINETIGALSFNWTASNGGLIPSGQVTNQNLTSLSAGTYSVAITDSFFTYTQSFTINLIPQYNNLSICYVSSDENQVTKNRIYLNNQGNYNVAFYDILKESNIGNVYTSIGTIPSNQNSFLDDGSNNISITNKYRVKLIDNCGNEMTNPTTHKTILLTASLGLSNTVNLSWNEYLGTNYNTYNIYRKVNNGSFNLLSPVPASGGISNYNDQTANTALNSYEYYVAIAVNTCSVQNRTTTNTEIKSNRGIIGNSLSSSDFNMADQVMLFPNPTSNLLNIKLNEGNDLISGEIYNNLGQKVLTITTTQFSVEQLPATAYFIKVITTKGNATKSFIKK